MEKTGDERWNAAKSNVNNLRVPDIGEGEDKVLRNGVFDAKKGRLMVPNRIKIKFLVKVKT